MSTNQVIAQDMQMEGIGAFNLDPNQLVQWDCPQSELVAVIVHPQGITAEDLGAVRVEDGAPEFEGDGAPELESRGEPSVASENEIAFAGAASGQVAQGTPEAPMLSPDHGYQYADSDSLDAPRVVAAGVTPMSSFCAPMGVKPVMPIGATPVGSYAHGMPVASVARTMHHDGMPAAKTRQGCCGAPGVTDAAPLSALPMFHGGATAVPMAQNPSGVAPMFHGGSTAVPMAQTLPGAAPMVHGGATPVPMAQIPLGVPAIPFGHTPVASYAHGMPVASVAHTVGHAGMPAAKTRQGCCGAPSAAPLSAPPMFCDGPLGAPPMFHGGATPAGGSMAMPYAVMPHVQSTSQPQPAQDVLILDGAQESVGGNSQLHEAPQLFDNSAEEGCASGGMRLLSAKGQAIMLGENFTEEMRASVLMSVR